MEKKLSILSRFGIPVLLMVLGAAFGSLMGNSFNGHGPEAGFAGMFFGLFMVFLVACSNIITMFARDTRVATYSMGVGVFAAGVFCGMLFLH
jgi:hypothetical protein